jgi:hypothetical protein
MAAWQATTIVVESVLFEDVRRLVRRVALRVHSTKLAYLLGCHLCTGTWVGFALVAIVPGVPFRLDYWPLSLTVNGLVIAGGGRVLLELTSLARSKNEQLARINTNN